jgi:hypothetical protein
VQLVTAVVEQQDSSRSSGTRLVIVVAAIVRIGGRRGGGCRRGGVRVMRGGARVASSRVVTVRAPRARTIPPHERVRYAAAAAVALGGRTYRIRCASVHTAHT